MMSWREEMLRRHGTTKAVSRGVDPTRRADRVGERSADRAHRRRSGDRLRDVAKAGAPSGGRYDNALAESFVDSFKTELIADRIWHTRSQLELAVVEYLGWFNSGRLHQALGDPPPAGFEALSPPQAQTITSTIMSKETQLTQSP